MELLKTEFVPGDPSVLQVDGEIDVATAEQLRNALERAFSTDVRAVIDMAGVTFFDAAGLRVVLQIASARNGAGPITLVNARRVAHVLELVALSDLPYIVIRDEGDVRER